jgi:Na+-translocating ferredoxin:NAD+ oxidoreductase subunit A
MTWAVFFTSLISAMLVNNIILARFLGICPFLGVSKKVESAIGMGAAVLFVMMIASIITYPMYMYILEPLGIGYMDTIAFILVIAALVQLVELIIKKTSKGLYKSLGVYLPLITTNCAILGVAQGNKDVAANYLDALTITFGTGLGFMLIMFAFSSIRIRLESANVPKAFQGVPISLITAGLMSLAFLGLSGLV